MRQRARRILLYGGQTKSGWAEDVRSLELHAGDVVALVGPTGSGKSQLLMDIEQRAAGDSPTRRVVHLDGSSAKESRSGMIAALSQSMRFVIDLEVSQFLSMHAQSRGANPDTVARVIDLTNKLSGEPVAGDSPLTVLSGGQSRALMIADIALISRAPVVLIDEIENAGIDKTRALEILAEEGKTVIVASHDPVVILQAERRVVMRNGGMHELHERSSQEEDLLAHLVSLDREVGLVRDALRSGEPIGVDVEMQVGRRCA